MSLLVAAIILPALLLLFRQGTRNLEAPVITATAAFLAQEIMEKEILPARYHEISPWENRAVPGSEFVDYSSSCSVEFVEIDLMNQIDFSPVSNDAGWKLVTVTVEWSGNPAYRAKLTTLRTDWDESE